MRVIYPEDVQQEMDFAETARKRFEEDPQIMTYASKIEPGELFAVRWGLHGKAVLVLHISEDHEPVIYGSR